MKEPIHILLLEVPQLLRGILEHAIQQQSDCKLLKGEDRDFKVRAEGAAPPDVVILGLTAAEDCSLVPALFARWPWARVMTVMSTGAGATVYELKPQRRLLGQMSPEDIVAVLRAVAQRSARSRGSSRR
jgi:hypothetical protein